MASGGIGRFNQSISILTGWKQNGVTINAPATVATSFGWTLPNAQAGVTSFLRVTAAGQLEYVDASTVGGVTALSLSTDADTVLSLTNPTTTPQIGFDTQAQNLFFMSPVGATGVPTFRGIAYADVSSIVGNAASTLAAGDDPRLLQAHDQNTDTGTTQTGFIIDSGNTGPQIANSGGTLQARNNGNTGFVDIAVNDLVYNASKAQNSVLAAPTGAAGAPTFRALDFTDVAPFVVSGSTNAAELIPADDPRIAASHTQNTDTGTDQVGFIVDSGNAGPQIKNEAGVMAIRNNADTDYADLTVNSLIVRGPGTEIISETVTIADNSIQLNTGATVDEAGGIELFLPVGGVNARVEFDPVNGVWQGGLAGALLPFARVVRRVFTDADLTAGVLTFVHGLGNQLVDYKLMDNTGEAVGDVDVANYTNGTTATFDLSSFGALTGNWTIMATG